MVEEAEDFPVLIRWAGSDEVGVPLESTDEEVGPGMPTKQNRPFLSTILVIKSDGIATTSHKSPLTRRQLDQSDLGVIIPSLTLRLIDQKIVGFIAANPANELHMGVVHNASQE